METPTLFSAKSKLLSFQKIGITVSDFIVSIRDDSSNYKQRSYSSEMSQLKLPVTGKVGEVPPDESKFLHWSGQHAYYSRPEVETPSFLTEKQMKGTFSKSDLITNKAIVTQLYQRNKSQVDKGKNVFSGSSSNNLHMTNTQFNALSTTLKGRTTIGEHFIHHRHYLHQLKEYGSTEALERSFHKFLKYDPSNAFAFSKTFQTINNQTSTPTGTLTLDVTQPRISLFDIDLVVKDCIGDDVPEFVLDKLKILGNSVAIHGEITWKDFISVFDKVTKAVEAECTVRHDPPGLILLMNQPRLHDPKLGNLGDLSTTYRDNFNGTKKFNFGETSPSSSAPGTPLETLRYEAPREEIGNNLNNSAKILCAGTTLGTHHVPGYRGHIPSNVRNIRKADHASGKDPHPVVNDLILTQRNMGCVLGYTGQSLTSSLPLRSLNFLFYIGYVPIEFNGIRQERKTSCDPRTSNGAAYGGGKAML